jgi:predicted lipoprotein with Yx(FWY)xxD motif
MSALIDVRSTRTRVLLLAVGTAALAVLAACGADQSTGAASTGGDHAASAVVRAESGAGGRMLLVDRNGRTLYAADQEGAGKDIRCTQTCLGFWFPLTVSSHVVRGDGISADRLGTVRRPDNGATQVALDGKPLYTFKLDTAAGMIKGDGFTDAFDGTTFDWHAATVGAGTSGSSGTQDNGSGGPAGY